MREMIHIRCLKVLMRLYVDIYLTPTMDIRLFSFSEVVIFLFLLDLFDVW